MLWFWLPPMAAVFLVMAVALLWPLVTGRYPSLARRDAARRTASWRPLAPETVAMPAYCPAEPVPVESVSVDSGHAADSAADRLLAL